jgi:hypothetical protein
MRTFTKTTIEASCRAWADGGFGREWDDIRQRAAQGGILFPPAGHAHDDPTVRRPSQAAIVARALDQTPQLLEQALVGATSWRHVVARLIAARDDRRAAISAEEAHADGPDRAEAAAILAAIERLVAAGAR